MRFMRLLSHVSRKYKGKEYEKSWIVLPSKLLKELHWKTGQDLEAEVNHDNLIISKNDKTRVDLITRKK